MEYEPRPFYDGFDTVGEYYWYMGTGSLWDFAHFNDSPGVAVGHAMVVLRDHVSDYLRLLTRSGVPPEMIATVLGEAVVQGSPDGSLVTWIGEVAVAWVIMNRANDYGGGADIVRRVIEKPKQFDAYGRAVYQSAIDFMSNASQWNPNRFGLLNILNAGLASAAAYFGLGGDITGGAVEMRAWPLNPYAGNRDYEQVVIPGYSGSGTNNFWTVRRHRRYI
jgi:hypothetical protein